jgi:hypothetical protein
MANIEAFSGALTELQGACVALKKYEQSFSVEAKQLFQVRLSNSVGGPTICSRLGQR